MLKDETFEQVENKLPECEEEYTFEIEELESQQAMMMLIPLDVSTQLPHQSKP